jgi:hypothetical protein
VAIRWVNDGRVSYQRVGALTAVCALAPTKQSTTLEALSRAVFSALTRLVSIDEDHSKDVAQYLERLQLSKRYGDLQGLSASELVGKKLEAQDIWLSNSGLRASATGAITPDVINEPVQLAIELGLVRPRGCTLVDTGKALRVATSRSAEALTSPTLDGNLFSLSPGAGFAAAYVLLDADYDFMRAAYAVAAEEGLLQRQFSRREFATHLDQACIMLRDQNARRARTRTDELALRRLTKLAESIRKAPEASTRGGARPPDKTATLRTEPYVDVGLLSRVDRFAYRYRMSVSQLAFFEALVDATDAESFLNETLGSLYVRSTQLQSREASDDEIWEAMVTSYPQMRSSLGYASFKELAVVAISTLLDRVDPAHFEVADGVRVLKERQRSEPARVKFGVKRGGGLSYVKLGRAQ